MFYKNKENDVYYSFLKTMKLNYRCNQKILEKKGLYTGQPALLIILIEKGPQSQKDLANKLNIKPSTVNVMVKRLEKSNLVTRVKDKDDQRISRVIITEKGEKIAKDAIKNLQEMNRAVFSNLSSSEENDFKFLLSKINKGLIDFLDKND